jgi:hypothetical protein
MITLPPDFVNLRAFDCMFKSTYYNLFLSVVTWKLDFIPISSYSCLQILNPFKKFEALDGPISYFKGKL